MPVWWVISKMKLKAFVYPKAANRAATVGDEVSVAGSVDEANLPHPFICWLDSIDRRRWLLLHARKMMEGCIVVTDRYPSPSFGLDSARIVAEVRHTLAR